MRQVEVSRTMVFDQPRNGRAFFETLVADNLDLGRPEKVELIFGRRIPKTSQATGVFATRVVTRGVDVTINARYKHSRVKQYFKQGRALRIETVINDPNDLGVLRRIVHLDELVGKARAVNRRLLDAERVGQGCVLASPAFERIARPSLVDGRRAPALRFGDPRVMALAGALAVSSNLIGGFSNKTIRPLIGGLLGEPYNQARCCYDLRRLKLKGLIRKVAAHQHLCPHPGRATLRDLLHQGREPGPATAASRRPDPRTARRQAEPANPRTGRHRLPHPRRPARLKLGSIVKPLATKGHYARSGTSPGTGGPFGAALVPVGGSSYGRRMADDFSERYGDLSDRLAMTVWTGSCSMPTTRSGINPGGFRVWWRRLARRRTSTLDNTHLMRMAGRFARRVRALGPGARRPGDRLRQRGTQAPDRRGLPGRPSRSSRGVFLILVARAPATVWEVNRTAGGCDQQPGQEAGVRQPLLLPHHGPELGTPDDQDVRASTVRRAGHPQRPRVRRLPAPRRAGIGLLRRRATASPGSLTPQRLAQIADTLSQPGTAGRLGQVCDAGSTPPACVSGWTSTSRTAAGSATTTRSTRSSTAGT